MDNLIKSSQNLIPLEDERDILTAWLCDQRSPTTRSAYGRDLKNFFIFITKGQEPTPELVAEFLQLSRFNATALVLKYKAYLFTQDLKQSTVNRRVAAIKALVKYARRLGKCDFTLEEIHSEKPELYRIPLGLVPN